MRQTCLLCHVLGFQVCSLSRRHVAIILYLLATWVLSTTALPLPRFRRDFQGQQGSPHWSHDATLFLGALGFF